VGNGGGSEVLHPEKKTRGEAGPKMWAKRAPAQSSLRGGEEVVAPVISGDSGDTSATGVDGRLRESKGGGVAALRDGGGDGVEGGKRKGAWDAAARPFYTGVQRWGTGRRGGTTWQARAEGGPRLEWRAAAVESN
jgi:hypothetical protein